MSGPLHGGGCLTDVPGVCVGHTQRVGRGWRTGTTVVLLPENTVGSVEVRGGGPGTRETDLLHPTATMQMVHAICLTGGSAYGLAAAHGVMGYLEERSIGFKVGLSADHVVPIVPAAVIFDLGRGGGFGNRPDESFGRRAAAAARGHGFANGAIGAGAGARARGLQGGVGTASTILKHDLFPNGVVVSALAVVNSAGTVIDPATALPWMAGSQRLRSPSAADRRALRAHLEAATPPLNTTIGVVATTAALSKTECNKLASVAHDGLARAIRPVHSMLDGDSIFAVAIGRDDLGSMVDSSGDGEPPARPRVRWLNAVLEAGAACFAAACTNAIVHASGNVDAPSYRDICPSAFPARQ